MDRDGFLDIDVEPVERVRLYDCVPEEKVGGKKLGYKISIREGLAIQTPLVEQSRTES